MVFSIFLFLVVIFVNLYEDFLFVISVFFCVEFGFCNKFGKYLSVKSLMDLFINFWGVFLVLMVWIIFLYRLMFSLFMFFNY